MLAADDFSDNANTQVVDVTKIPEGWQGLDAGPKSQEIFDEVVNLCKIILWNGPLGVFELETFSKGTIMLGNSIDKATLSPPAHCVICSPTMSTNATLENFTPPVPLSG